MLLSTAISKLYQKGESFEWIIDTVKKAGFDAMDFSFQYEEFRSPETDTAKFKQEFTELRKRAEDKGQTVIEASPESDIAGDYRELAQKMIEICERTELEKCV